ncbi:hypothetical protein BJ912DRAFT_924027 [Pholiota molesta]|nr:hypothetical protein BJ912DRAFT_924027 [Pholiota molesta]
MPIGMASIRYLTALAAPHENSMDAHFPEAPTTTSENISENNIERIAKPWVDEKDEEDDANVRVCCTDGVDPRHIPSGMHDKQENGHQPEVRVTAWIYAVEAGIVNADESASVRETGTTRIREDAVRIPTPRRDQETKSKDRVAYCCVAERAGRAGRCRRSYPAARVLAGATYTVGAPVAPAPSNVLIPGSASVMETGDDMDRKGEWDETRRTAVMDCPAPIGNFKRRGIHGWP